MPYSDNSNVEWIRWILDLHKPTSAVDLGAGAGKYGKLIKEVLPECHVTGVEIWGPYIKEFDLESIYDKVIICDARIFPKFDRDLVIFGDVLEHMTSNEAIAIWEKVSKQAKFAIISIPIIHYHQDEYAGNPFEAHVDPDWNHERVLESFSGITGYQLYPETGVYFAEF